MDIMKRRMSQATHSRQAGEKLDALLNNVPDGHPYRETYENIWNLFQNSNNRAHPLFNRLSDAMQNLYEIEQTDKPDMSLITPEANRWKEMIIKEYKAFASLADKFKDSKGLVDSSVGIAFRKLTALREENADVEKYRQTTENNSPSLPPKQKSLLTKSGAIPKRISPLTSVLAIINDDFTQRAKDIGLEKSVINTLASMSTPNNHDGEPDLLSKIVEIEEARLQYSACCRKQKGGLANGIKQHTEKARSILTTQLPQRQGFYDEVTNLDRVHKYLFCGADGEIYREDLQGLRPKSLRDFAPMGFKPVPQLPSEALQEMREIMSTITASRPIEHDEVMFDDGETRIIDVRTGEIIDEALDTIGETR